MRFSISAAASTALFALSLIPASVQAVSSTGSRVLVALDKGLKQDDYSLFWKSLENRGYSLTFKGPKEEQPSLTTFDEKSFDHLILFTPNSKSYSSDLTPQSLVSYLSKKGSILMAMSPSISEFSRDFAREFSLEFQPSDTNLIDHIHYSPTLDVNNKHTVIAIPASDSVSTAGHIFPMSTRSGPPILYSGIAHSVIPASGSELLVPMLKAPSTSYSAEARFGEGSDDSPYPADFLAGTSAKLVTAMQTLDNARITFVGSVDLFSDKFWKGEFKDANGKTFIESGNKAFVSDVTAWTFQEKGVLRLSEPKHSLVGGSGPRTITDERASYRIKDDVTFSMNVEQHVTTANGSSAWVPYMANDIQLSFTMLDPHIRTFLIPVEGSKTGEHKVDFKTPDRHGVFKFVVDHKRTGWSFLSVSQVAAVVPFRHDEYPRFLSGAYPFYMGAFSTSGAFLVFCLIWLFWKEPEKVDEVKKSQ